MIDREEFTDAVHSVFGDSVEDLLFNISKGTRTEDFNLFLQNDTVFIIDTVNEIFINWYKLGHVGRSLQICGRNANNWKVPELKQFLRNLKNQLKL